MGQKVHPNGFVVGFSKNWRSRWATDKGNYAALVYEDYKIRELIKRQAAGAGIASIEIERRGEEISVFVSAARQGILIGKKGQEIDRIREMVQDVASGPVKIIIREVGNPDAVAQIVAESISDQLLKRMAFRRVMKKALDTTYAAGVQGVKIRISGRLNGAEMARCEKVGVGRMPLQTIMSDIDYGFAQSFTTYGAIGIKVWIYNGPKDRRTLHPENQSSE